MVLLSLVYFVKGIHQREFKSLKFSQKERKFWTIFVILKQGGCALQIKVAYRDQENIFSF